tara:strand:+ start:289 stop:672 length:384 start_codon:yes stop_codon:yes gene_type:complete
LLNFTTQKEYQGSNIDQLTGLGTEFCTFNQAVDYYNITGKELKGAKSCARLMKIVDREVYNKLSGKKEKKKVPFYFNVFEKNHLIKTMLSNGHAPFEGTDEQEYNADMEAYDIGSYYCNKLLRKEGA